jgi:BON domain
VETGTRYAKPGFAMVKRTMKRFSRQSIQMLTGPGGRDGKSTASSRRTTRLHDLAAVTMCVILVGSCLLQAAPKEQPSDELIYDHVIRKLVNDRDLKTNRLKVTVEDAVVTVTGQVASEKLRRKVSKVVKGTKGVKKVINEVTVRE